MTDENQQHPVSKLTVAYRIPGVEAVQIRRDVEVILADGEASIMDLYYPPSSAGSIRHPAIVIVAGYPDPGCQKILGCRYKEMGSCVSWGCLIAASGMAAIAYSNREPVTDLQAVLGYVRQNAEDLGIDENRIGLWAASGSGPLALFSLMTPGQEFLKCAVLCYPYSLDLDGNTGVADAARQFGFVTPAAGKSVDDIATDISLLVVRAGEDEFPRLNESLDRFIGKALARNLPLTLLNHSRAPHAFDVQDDGEVTRETIRQILAFMRFCLRS